MKRKLTGSATLLAKHGKIIKEEYFGVLFEGSRDVVDTQTMFDLQSMTKSFLSYLIYVHPKLKNLETLGQMGDFGNYNKILIIDILNHSAGFSDKDLDTSFTDVANAWSYMFNCPLHYTGGAQIGYSDLGYRILGRCVEIYLSLDLGVLFEEWILRPLSMKNTTYNPKEGNCTGSNGKHGFIDDDQTHFLGGMTGSDGLYSSARDLFLFLQNLDKDYFDFLLRNIKTSPSEQKSFYTSLAYGSKVPGWEINSPNFRYAFNGSKGTVLEKAGGAGTFMSIDLATNSMFIHLTNYGRPVDFAEEAWDRLCNEINPSKKYVELASHES